ncbi:MAG: phosphoesterase [Ruminococcaceae bacterium]|nr:phosphoesterase [Oscillospiraceae bacterium]
MPKDGKRVFFIADTHFGHSKIIEYANRPFQDTAKMDERLIRLWNATVRAQDEVFMLGDFAFGPKERAMEIGQRLSGRKTLIMGNHDTRSVQTYRECGFETVSRWPIIYNGFWLLSHEPMQMPEGMPFANIFGHIHDAQYENPLRRRFCVSVEQIDYRPIELGEIMKALGITDENLPDLASDGDQ